MKRIIFIVMTAFTVLFCFNAICITVNAEVISSEGSFPFIDVSVGAWYWDEVEFCYVNDAVSGMNQYSYKPNGTLTRAQFIVMLANAVDADLSEYKTSSFTDVKAGVWYAPAIEWGYRNGYVEGMGDSKFVPSDNINREQICSFFARYIKKNHPDIKPVEYGDMQFHTGGLSYWAQEGVRYCYAVGIITGMTDNSMHPPTLSLMPKNDVTRAQAARMMSQFLQNVYYSGCEHSYSQPTCTASAECECGIRQGFPLGHSCTKLNCITGSECSRCGEYISSDGALHNLTAAQCLEGPRCMDCGVIYGFALGHTTSNGECTRCGEGIFPDDHARIIYYVKKEGAVVGQYYRYLTDTVTEEGNKISIELFYLPPDPYPIGDGEGSLTLRAKYYLNEAQWIETRFSLDRGTADGERWFRYVVAYRTYEFTDNYVSGGSVADTMTKDDIIMTFEEGASHLCGQKETRDAMYNAVKYLDYAVRVLCGADTDIYHFYHIDG